MTTPGPPDVRPDGAAPPLAAARARELAREAWEHRDFAAVRRHLIHAVDAGDPPAELYNMIGCSFEEEGDIRSALDHWRQATEADPELFGPLYNRGRVLVLHHELTAGLEALQRALAIEPERASVHSYIGQAYLMQDRPAEAESNLRKGLTLEPFRTALKNNLAFALLLQEKDPEEAQKLAEQAVGAEPDEPSHWDTLARIYLWQGWLVEACAMVRRMVHQAAGDVELAALLKEIRQAMADAGVREEDDRALRARAEEATAASGRCREAGDLDQAIESMHAALRLWSGVGDQTRRMEADEAIEELEFDWLVEFEPKQAAYWLNDSGMGNLREGRPEEALACYNRALELTRTTAPDSIAPAVFLCNIGLVYFRQGDYEKALATAHEALQIACEIAPGSHHEAAVLAAIGHVWEDRGDIDRAMEFLIRARDLLSNCAPDSEAMASVLKGIGTIHEQVGEFDKGMACYEQSLDIRTRTAPESTASLLSSMAGIHMKCGDLNAALRCSERALDLQTRQNPYSQGTAATLRDAGDILNRQGETDRALKFYSRALAIDQRIAPESQGAATSISRVAAMAYRAGDYDKALDLGGQALDIHRREAPESRHTAVALANVALVHCWKGEFEAALPNLVEAIKVAESLRVRGPNNREIKAQYFGQFADYYEEAVAVLFELSQPERAFDYSERAKARGLLDLLAEREIGPGTHVDHALVERERILQRQLGKVYQALADARSAPRSTDDQTERLFAEQSRIERELDSLQHQIRAECPSYADLRYPRPLGLTAVKAELLNADVVLLEYFVGEGRSFVWCVSGDDVSSARIAVGAEDLERRVREDLRGRFDDFAQRDNPQIKQKQTETTRWLYDRFVKPVAPALTPGSHVVVVPDGALHYVPFEMLVAEVGEEARAKAEPDGGCRLLGEEYTFSYVSSATILKNIRDTLSQRGDLAEAEFIGFGDPDFDAFPYGGEARSAPGALSCDRAQRRGLRLQRIPATGTEVRGIFDLFAHDGDRPRGRTHVAGEAGDAKLRDLVALPAGERKTQGNGDLPAVMSHGGNHGYLRHEASERRACLEAGRYRFVHFATHGLLDDRHPLYSGIAFSPTAARDDPLVACVTW
jgi:tetratricopeptide (TPR) repeat protein